MLHLSKLPVFIYRIILDSIATLASCALKGFPFNRLLRWRLLRFSFIRLLHLYLGHFSVSFPIVRDCYFAHFTSHKASLAIHRLVDVLETFRNLFHSIGTLVSRKH